MATAQYLLENLGFLINFEKSHFIPTHLLEYLRFLVNTRGMTLLLPDCKVEAIKAHCTHLLAHLEVSVWVLSQLIEKLTASIQVILPAPQHYHHHQHQKHQALAQRKGSFQPVPSSLGMGFESKYFSERRRPLAVLIPQRFEQLAVVRAQR